MQARALKLGLGLTAAVLAGSCVRPIVLLPGPGAQQAPGPPAVAEAESSGVRVLVSGTAWMGPAAVYDVLTPLRVTLVNRSGRPLRIRLDLFALSGPSGFDLTALPPYQIAGQFPAPFGPSYPYGGLYPGYPPWWAPIPHGPYFHGWPYALPSREILEEALPEGVANDGGQVSGFLYFQRLSPSWRQATFQANLVDATTGEAFGRVSIPLVVAR